MHEAKGESAPEGHETPHAAELPAILQQALKCFQNKEVVDSLSEDDKNQKDVISRRNWQRPKHLNFFLLVLAKDKAQAQAQEGQAQESPSPNHEGQGQALNKIATFELPLYSCGRCEY